jgi:hypothetical protein
VILRLSHVSRRWPGPLALAEVGASAGLNLLDILAIFRGAWEGGCKGITVYRDGSRTARPKAL